MGDVDRALYLQDFTGFQSKRLEDKIQELIDREEIRELIARYALCVANSYSVADLFTEDGVYIHRIPGQPQAELRSRAEIAKFYAHWTPGDTNSPKPMIHNYMLSVSGNEATGICSNEVRMTRDGESMIGSGFYNDRFRRENGRWRFASRESIFFHMVPLHQGWATPAQQK